MAKDDKPAKGKDGSGHSVRKAIAGSARAHRDAASGRLVSGGKAPKSAVVAPAAIKTTVSIPAPRAATPPPKPPLSSSRQGREYPVAEARAALQALAGSARRGPVIPIQCMGKWVAWSADGQRIVAVGGSRRDVERAVAEGGLGEVAYEKLRPPTRAVRPKAQG